MYEIYKFLFYTPMVSHLLIWGSLKTECWGMGVIDAVRCEGIGQILAWLYFLDKIYKDTLCLTINEKKNTLYMK